MSAEWTVMVFLNAKNSLEPSSFTNFQQLAKLGSTSAVNLLVEYGRPARRSADMEYCAQIYGGWSKTLRFRVDKSMEATGPIESKALQDLGQVDMGDAASLQDFVRWSKANYPARRYMLVIWDHGQGWRAPSMRRLKPEELGTFPKTRRSVRHSHDAPTKNSVADDIVMDGSVRYVSNDDDFASKLYNRAIQDGLKAVLGAEKLDVLGFDACLMGMLESAYAFRGVADYMVGSEELEPGSGWNYQTALAPLIADPAAFDGKALASQIVTAYKNQYADHDATTLAALDLSHADAVAAAVSAFSNVARPLVAANAKKFKAARAACNNYAPGYPLNSIDLIHYVQSVATAMRTNTAVVAAAQKVIAAARAAVVANYAATSRQGAYGSNGIAIYYPITGQVFSADPEGSGYLATNTVFPVEFVQTQTWVKFLNAYFKAVP